jgi:osmotically-inducible protein OsmY
MFCSGYASLLFVDYEVEQDRVVLRGRVPTYHLKQIAQSVIQRVPGVSRVDNRLVVQRDGDPHRRGLQDANSDRQFPT